MEHALVCLCQTIFSSCLSFCLFLLTDLRPRSRRHLRCYECSDCDAVGELYSEFTKAGCDVNYGRTSTDGYMHVNSKAQVDETEPIFYGLCMDENVQADQSQPRAEAWIAQLKEEGFF